MSVKITSMANPVWANASHTKINCFIESDEFGDDVLPFTACKEDSELHCVDAFNSLVAGDFGAIAEYVPPADVVGEVAFAQVRQKRNEKLKAEVDPVVLNPLRWADMTAEQQQVWSDYRRALLDITTTYPNPSFVWNEDKQGYEETNIVWPVMPQ
jgi:Phage tail assembly chaperone protein